MDRLEALFASVADGGTTTAQRIQEKIAASGIRVDDFRLSNTMARLAEFGDRPITFGTFQEAVASELLMLNRVFTNQLVIPDWKIFCSDIETIYNVVEPDKGGRNADYIPILRDADPDKWGVAVCTVDGQRLALGDVDIYHSIQSVSKPLTYAFAIAEQGFECVTQYVGVEPSGRPFNDLDLLPDSRPFNPCVNTGAIMMAGLVASIRPQKNSRDITQEIMELWSALCGEMAPVLFSQETMLSERETADNNFAIAYLLKGRKGLPGGVDLHKMMDVYLSCCSIEMTANMLAVAAATLANGGVCPTTGRQILTTEVVKKTLAVMQAAGMYDSAGVFTLEVGLPAKSGVAGAVIVVVPSLMGFATFSPRLDPYGNSVRGVAFCRQLVNRFTFHMYDNLSGGRTGCKRDPRASQSTRKKRDLSDLCWAVSYGDLYAIKVRDLMLDCMLSICLADGNVEEQEIEMMASAYAEIMNQPADFDHLRGLAQERFQQSIHSDGATVNAFDNLISRLYQECSLLDDNGREMILESAFRVACADGIIQDSEDRQLRAIAKALAINEGVLELEISQFQRDVAVKSGQPLS